MQLRAGTQLPSTSLGVVSRPTYFKRKLGNLQKVWLGPTINWRVAKPRNNAKRAGISFERKATAALYHEYGDRFIDQFSFRFEEAVSWMMVERKEIWVDGLLFSPDFRQVTIIEIKLRHSADAYHQLWNFYHPIVARAFPALQVSCLEICKWYDPEVILPKPVSFVRSASEAAGLREAFHPVQIRGLT